MKVKTYAIVKDGFIQKDEITHQLMIYETDYAAKYNSPKDCEVVAINITKAEE